MISFSGIDCSGKSTQIDILCKEFAKRNIRFKVIWSRGGYTPGITFVKKIILAKNITSKEDRIAYSIKVNQSSRKRKLILLVSLIDLWAYYSIYIRIKELLGICVICDRYIWDTYIDFKMKYPEYNFENSFLWRMTLKTMVKPKMSFVLIIPAEESVIRSELKDEPFPETIEIRKERINIYINELNNNRWQCIVDATASIDKVFEQIKEKLNIV